MTFEKLEVNKNDLDDIFVWNPPILNKRNLLMIDKHNPQNINVLDIESSISSKI